MYDSIVDLRPSPLREHRGKETILASLPAMTQIRKPAYRRQNNTSVRIDPVEEALVQTIHRKVGGPSKLSTYDDPADVRDVVLRALANEQPTAADSDRIDRGRLTPLERRVVRTVTNRGAAVRSRMRQRKEMQRLREEIERKDAQLHQLAAMVAACSKHTNMARMNGILQTEAKVEDETIPETTLVTSDETPNCSSRISDAEESFLSTAHSGSWHDVAPPNSCASSSMESFLGFPSDNELMPGLNTSLDFQNFPNVIDPLS